MYQNSKMISILCNGGSMRYSSKIEFYVHNIIKYCSKKYERQWSK